MCQGNYESKHTSLDTNLLGCLAADLSIPAVPFLLACCSAQILRYMYKIFTSKNAKEVYYKILDGSWVTTLLGQILHGLNCMLH